MTARDLINGALRVIGAIGQGETPTAAESDDALKALNSMLGSWSVDGLIVSEVKQETFSTIANQQGYTIGTGGDFDTARPVKILEAGSIQDTSEMPLELINYQQWAGISVKSTLSPIPQKLYYETTNPLATIFLYPVPSTVTPLKLYSLKPLTSFASINDVVTLPPGYDELIKFNLAVRIAPEYGKGIDPTVERLAIESKLQIEKTNSRDLLLTSDLFAVIPRAYNIYTGA